jgi:signal peptidase I
MAPTIEKGDRVSVDLHAYAESDPEPGDLVMFRPDGTGDLKWTFRIAAVPGNTIGYEDDVLVRDLRSTLWIFS